MENRKPRPVGDEMEGRLKHIRSLRTVQKLAATIIDEQCYHTYIVTSFQPLHKMLRLHWQTSQNAQCSPCHSGLIKKNVASLDYTDGINFSMP